MAPDYDSPNAPKQAMEMEREIGLGRELLRLRKLAYALSERADLMVERTVPIRFAGVETTEPQPDANAPMPQPRPTCPLAAEMSEIAQILGKVDRILYGVLETLDI